MEDTANSDAKNSKVALHFHISKLASKLSAEQPPISPLLLAGDENSPPPQPEVSKEVVAAVTEAAFRFTQTLAVDLEAFCRHARRTVISGDDVKLVVRRNPSLLHHLTEMSENIAASELKKPKKMKGTKKGAKREGPNLANEPITIDDELSNQASRDSHLS